MNPVITALVISTALLLTGCAAGNRIDYRLSVPSISSLPAVEKKEIEVAVVDQRPYVTSGRKRQTFVGVMRALAYVPYNITTLSGLSLSNDLQQATLSSLRRQFLNARAGLSDLSKASSQDHLLLRMTLRDWKNDVYMRARFDYDITVEVIDHSGMILASKTAKHSGAINHFIMAGSSALQEVLGDEQVVAALTGRLALGSSRVDGAQSSNLAVPSSPSASTSQPHPSYDDCMRRVLKISDKQLRLSSMSACDGAVR